MLNIFIELWKAQQENQVVIPELYFPDTFILDENHDFIWLFRSKQEGKILRKKKLNASVETIVKSLVGQNLNQSIDQSYSMDSTNNLHLINQQQMNFNQTTVQAETPFATYSRLNDQGEIEIQHFTVEQIKRFFGEVEYKNALPRDSIFLQRYLRTDQNEIHNHFIKVVYNTNFIQIEKRKNCFFWQNLTENSNKPKDREYYNCLVTYEGPDQFTEVEKINEYTANQLKYVVKQICIQLESIHAKERGKVKQISLIFKKINDIIYLLHCNEISFEREQHIPKLWRMSFNNPFVVPLHIKCAPKPLLVPQQYQQQQQRSNPYGNKSSNCLHNDNRISNNEYNQSQQLINISEQQRSTKLLENSKNGSESRLNNPNEISKLQMCISCGQGCQQLQEVMKNKLLRIRIKRGVRENFNGLRPLYDTQQKQDKALFDKYTTVKVCIDCYFAYQEIQQEDETLQSIQTNENYGYTVNNNTNNNRNQKGQQYPPSNKTRSKSFNLVSLDHTQNNDGNTSLLNGQFLTPLDGSSYNRRKSAHQYQVEEDSVDFDSSILRNVNDQSFQQQRDQSFTGKMLQDNSIDLKAACNKSLDQKSIIQSNLREKSTQSRIDCMQSKTLKVENKSDENSLFNINKRHHSLSKAQQINPTYYQLNKNLQFKFKELRSKSTNRSQNVSRILPNLQNEDSFLNDTSFIQKANNLSTITPITAADQKTISEALNLLSDQQDNQFNEKGEESFVINRKPSRIAHKSVGVSRGSSITPIMKQQYQVILQSANITPVNNSMNNNNINNLSTLSIQQQNNYNNRNNKSSINVISNYFSNPIEEQQSKNRNDAFLKQFYQQQALEKDKKQSEQYIEFKNSSNSSRDYISINHITSNQCLKSEDILNRMRDINTSRDKIQDSHEKIISDYNQIYQDQKYQVQILKQKSNYSCANTAQINQQNINNGTKDSKNNLNRSRNSSAASKTTNNTSSSQMNQRKSSTEMESRLLTNIRYLERQLQGSGGGFDPIYEDNIKSELSFDNNQKENVSKIANFNSNNSNSNLGSIKQQQSNQKFLLPPKPSAVLSQKSINQKNGGRIKIPLTQNPESQEQILNNKVGRQKRHSFQQPSASNNCISPPSVDESMSGSEPSQKSLSRRQMQKDIPMNNNKNTSQIIRKKF